MNDENLYTKKKYLIGISYAHEKKDFVERVALRLSKKFGKEKIFFDAFWEAELSRPDLDDYLVDIFLNQCELVVFFDCASYSEKEWPQLEFRAIKELIKKKKGSIIMPIRLDHLNNGKLPNFLSIDGFLDANSRTPEEIADLIIERADPIIELLEKSPINQYKPKITQKISVERLPITGENLFGRENEISILEKAWEEDLINIVSFIAIGGMGKSALVNEWNARMAKKKYPGVERAYAWSFYTQSRFDQITSADFFISEALKWFGYKGDFPKSPNERAQILTEYIQNHRTLLILDGIEPLQYPPGPYHGQIKDPALSYLLKSLASHNNGLCIITTRIKITELSSYEEKTVYQYELNSLGKKAGAQLLKSLNVQQGNDTELEKASGEFKGHGLALTLLGTYLRDFHNGDIRKRTEIRQLEEEEEHGGHAKRVLDSYEKWFGDGPEVSILKILGFFDRPIQWSFFKILLSKPNIPDLTEKCSGLNEIELKKAVTRLEKARLLEISTRDEHKFINTHPLIREHFANKIKKDYPNAWIEGHKRLYEHLKNSAPELPNSLKKMEPLFDAVVHGCNAQKHQEVFIEVYNKRIRRGKQHFSWSKLGALGTDLHSLSYFFDSPFERPSNNLDISIQANLQGIAGTELRALGRINESVTPTKSAIQKYKTLKDWKNAADFAAYLSEIYLSLGKLEESKYYAKLSIEYAEESKSIESIVCAKRAFADYLHQSGQFSDSEKIFREAKKIEINCPIEHPMHYSPANSRFCELLLDQGECILESNESFKDTITLTKDHFDNKNFINLKIIAKDRIIEVKELLESASREKKNNWSNLAVGLYDLILGKALLLEARLKKDPDFNKAKEHLNNAVLCLGKAELRHLLPCGLLARAVLNRIIGELDAALNDLREAFTIINNSSLQLMKVDYHIESAKIYKLKKDLVEARKNLESAENFIKETGYHRRDWNISQLKNDLLYQ